MDNIDMMAKAIHDERPVTVEGLTLEWDDVVHSYPDRASEYREAARNRLRVEEAMDRLKNMPGPKTD